MTILQPWPDALSRSTAFQVRVDGRELPVLACDRGAVVQWIEDGSATVEVEIRHLSRSADRAMNVAVRPQRLGIQPAVDGAATRFRLAVPGRVLVEIDGAPLLCLFAEPAPTPAPSGARRLEPGKIHELGLVRLESGEHLDIPPGAVLRGRVELRGEGASVGGGGWIDGSANGGQFYSLVTDRATKARISDLTVVNPTLWMTVIGGSHDVVATDLRLLGTVYSSDGVDVVGSSRVRVGNCFMINGDDCLVVKSLDPAYTADGGFTGWSNDVHDVVFEHCIVGNYRGGSATEIGHELRCDRVSDVTFRDIDVMFVHEHGAVFSLHHADRALVERIRWQHIRIEHCFDKLMDLRIVESRWGKDRSRGRVRDLRIDDVDWWVQSFNGGHTVSVVGGIDSDHRVDGVTISRFRLSGVPVTTLDQLDVFCRHATDVRLEPV